MLPSPARSQCGHRLYARVHLERLGFIRHARQLGFAMPAMRDPPGMADNPDADSTAAHALATAQLAEIDSRLRRLSALRAELGRMPEGCAGGVVGACGIVGTLADFGHGHCADPTHGKRQGGG